jgi:hypothetical protein
MALPPKPLDWGHSNVVRSTGADSITIAGSPGVAPGPASSAGPATTSHLRCSGLHRPTPCTAGPPDPTVCSWHSTRTGRRPTAAQPADRRSAGRYFPGSLRHPGIAGHSILGAQSLASAFSTVSLTPPQKIGWYFDTGATSHMTSNAGTLSNTSTPSLTTPSSVIVGDGSLLPVISTGSTTLHDFCSPVYH